MNSFLFFDSIVNFFTNTLASYLTLDYLLYIVIGLFIVSLVAVYILSSNSYEVKANKAISNINAYLVANQYINEENLVSFNKLMKSAPADIRYQWQQYVLNRDKDPSNYLSRQNCVEKPLQTSSYHASIHLLKNLTIVLGVITFIFGLVVNADKVQSIVLDGFSQNAYVVAMLFLRALIIPTFIVIVSSIYAIFLRTRVNSLTATIYQAFYDFERNIDKAVSTLPDYIDYETLFTKQEIKSGIPLLQEYLERRDRQQQEDIKRAMEREAEHEKYDFDSTGIDGSLLLERAMKESELFIVNRKRLLAEIEQLQTEKENNKKNFDNATKEVNRKLQATKENLEKFKKQQEQSLNRIETNYIRKQQAEEVRKQQDLERDLEEAVHKFDEAQASIDREIQSRNDEIQENKKYVEEAMLSEFDTFTEKTYKILYDNVESKLGERINQIKENTEEQQQQIEDLTLKLAEKEENENKIVDEYEVTVGELEKTKRQLEDIQKLYDQSQMLYNELLVKFSALNAGDIKVEGYKVVATATKEQVEDIKNEIINTIINNSLTPVINKKGSDNTDGEKVIKEEPKAEEQPKVKEPVEQPKVEEKKEEQKVEEIKPEEPAEQPKVEEQVQEPVKVEEAKEEPKVEEEIETAAPKTRAKRTTSSTAKKPATTRKRKAQTTAVDDENKAEELKKKRAEARKQKREEENKKKQDALLEIQRRIDEENSRLVQQHNDLKEFIDNTIKVINEEPAEQPKVEEQVQEPAKVEQVKEEPKVEEPKQEQVEQPQNNKEEFDSIDDMFNAFKNSNK